MDLINKFYIINKHEVADILLKEISISDILNKFYGVNIQYGYGERVSIPCPIHKGKNKNFTVYKKTNTCHCFSKCVKTYNIISLAYNYYGSNDFNYIAIKLALDFNINIKQYLRVKKGAI